LEKYLRFLSSGGCVEPITLLMDLGIDLTSEGIYQKVMKVINRELNEIEKINSKLSKKLKAKRGK